MAFTSKFDSTAMIRTFTEEMDGASVSSGVERGQKHTQTMHGSAWYPTDNC